MFAHLLRRLKRGRPPIQGGPAVAAAELAAIPALVQSGQGAQAELQLRAVLRRQPQNVDALHYLGLICHQTGRHPEALRHLGAAVACAPDLAVLRANFAEALRAAGNLEEAEHEARAALRLDPAQAAAEFNLAAILAGRGCLTEALEHALQALRAQSDWPEALVLAANLYIALDKRAKAQELLTRARELRPEDPATMLLSLRNRAWLCDWSADAKGDSHRDHAALVAVLKRWAERPGDAAYRDLNPFVAYEYPVSQTLRDAVTQAYADGLLEGCRSLSDSGSPAWRCSAPERAARRRLRIAYVSADFHRHPTMHLMRGLFALHDRSRFEVFAYSMGADDGSDYRRHVVNTVDHFVDISREATLQSAQRLARDGIDILVDLKGFTHAARPGIFALRPAPIRVAWLGYPASTGRGMNDYIIVDRIVAPAADQAHFGEQLVWMPHSYQVNDDQQPIAAHAPSRSSLGLPEKAFVFACFNHVYKIDPRMFATWMRILRRVSDSVLWLYAADPAARANLEQTAAACGIDARRLIFATTLSKSEHLARLRRADLFLDTLWINAHTGASDALWAGVPVLTCPQDAFPSRVGASLVTAAGLPQLICADLEEYENKAVSLAVQPGALQVMRTHLETLHAALPLFDTQRFARNLERAFETMWQRHVAGLPAQAFAVDEPPSG